MRQDLFVGIPCTCQLIIHAETLLCPTLLPCYFCLLPSCPSPLPAADLMTFPDHLHPLQSLTPYLSCLGHPSQRTSSYINYPPLLIPSLERIYSRSLIHTERSSPLESQTALFHAQEEKHNLIVSTASQIMLEEEKAFVRCKCDQ